MDIDEGDADVSAYLAIDSGLKLVTNVSGVALLPVAENVYGNSVNAVRGALSLEKIPIGGKLYFAREVQFNRGMQINEVGRSNEIGFAEVRAFGE